MNQTKKLKSDIPGLKQSFEDSLYYIAMKRILIDLKNIYYLKNGSSLNIGSFYNDKNDLVVKVNLLDSHGISIYTLVLKKDVPKNVDKLDKLSTIKIIFKGINPFSRKKYDKSSYLVSSNYLIPNADIRQIVCEEGHNVVFEMMEFLEKNKTNKIKKIAR